VRWFGVPGGVVLGLEIRMGRILTWGLASVGVVLVSVSVEIAGVVFDAGISTCSGSEFVVETSICSFEGGGPVFTGPGVVEKKFMMGIALR
jgi:hypothetical protein